MAKRIPKQGSNRTGSKNGPHAGKPGPQVRAMDWERIATLSKMQCTMAEICAVEGISREWLDVLCEREQGMKIGEYVEQFRDHGKVALRRAQFKNAIEKGNVQMQIWLGKNMLKQSEKIEHYEMPEPVIIERINGDQIELGSQPKGRGEQNDSEARDGDNS